MRPVPLQSAQIIQSDAAMVARYFPVQRRPPDCCVHDVPINSGRSAGVPQFGQAPAGNIEIVSGIRALLNKAWWGIARKGRPRARLI
jgi:hypothetical protein